jgi:hypothetical protein
MLCRCWIPNSTKKKHLYFCNHDYANAPQRYVIRTLPVLFFSANTLSLTELQLSTIIPRYTSSRTMNTFLFLIRSPFSPRRCTSSRKTIVVPGLSSRLSSAQQSSPMRRTSRHFPNGLRRNTSIASSVIVIVALL